MTTNNKPATVKKVATKILATVPKGVARKSTSAASKAKVVHPLKKDKPEKIKVVRDSFSMPEADYEKLIDLKKKCTASGIHVKKSELIRLGLLQLSKLSNASLLSSAKRISSVKKNKGLKA